MGKILGSGFGILALDFQVSRVHRFRFRLRGVEARVQAVKFLREIET